MDLFQAIILGLVQGLTEFVPVSSSGHLVLVPWLLGWPKPSLTFDTTLHLGTLLAVLVYFRDDIGTLARAWLGSIARRSLSCPYARVAWLVALATVPAVVVGVAFRDFIEYAFSSPQVVGVFLIGTAAILVLAESLGSASRGKITEIGWLGALTVGLAQALAILPGVSRSGSTIAAGLLVGISRAEAARFSFLLAIPIIFGAGAAQLISLVSHPEPTGHLTSMMVGFVVAAVSGYLAIGLLLGYLRERSLYVFATYAGLLGALVVFISLGR